MKNNWTIISIGIGLFGGLLSQLIVKDWRVFLLVSIIVSIFMLLRNPEKRYFRAFWVVLSMFLVLNRFFFKIVGQIGQIDFTFGSNEIHWIVSLFLLILAGICLRLDFLERNNIKESFPSFFNIRINSPNVNSDSITQGNNSNYTKVIVNGDYLERGQQKKRISEIDEIEQYTKREEEVIDLIKNLPKNESGKIRKYENELEEIRIKSKESYRRISKIAIKINELGEFNPQKAKQAENELFKGYYGSAKDILFEIQQERHNKKIAKKLGITYNELLELEYEVEDGHTSKDGMVYYYIMKFIPDSPKEIIENLNGVREGFNGYELDVEPWFFDYVEEEEF